MLILLFFAFVSGLVTILAPCIWPLLPIILSTSLNGGKAKSLGITFGIMVSFAVFTLSVSYLVNIFGFDPNLLRTFAVMVLVFLGLMMILPPLARLVETGVSRLSGKFSQGERRTGFTGGFITGATLGIVWTPCAGPILAAIATLAATSQVNFGIILVTIVYVIGIGIPLFAFSYGGQKLVTGTRFLSRYTGRIQQVFGVILLLTALSIFTNYDKVMQARLLDAFPSYGQFITELEGNDAVKKQLDILRGRDEPDDMVGQVFSPTDMNSLPVIRTAPDFVGIDRWLNSEPLTMRGQSGKVVLIDFWTYTCINCIRTLPFIAEWHDKYKDQGLVIVGVHTPEFEFEKSTDNVADAIKRFNIHYPVAQDNEYKTWDAFENQYWPAKYLIDKNGRIRYVHFGEGAYEETEKAIQTLLKDAGMKPTGNMVDVPDETPRTQRSPETYLGSSRSQLYYPDGYVSNGTKNYTLSQTHPLSSYSLGGSWMITNEYARGDPGSRLSYRFYGTNVFLVMRPTGGAAGKVTVYLDGERISGEQGGADVVNGQVTVDVDRLYHVVQLSDGPQEHILLLEFENGGVEAYAFTFG